MKFFPRRSAEYNKRAMYVTYDVTRSAEARPERRGSVAGQRPLLGPAG